jgi:2'-5' RNA ligase
LRSSGEQRATELQRNEVRASPLWARPCRAYNVQIELDPATRASLGQTQQSLKRAESNLLVCPSETLHVGVARLLAVHASYPAPKDSIWERHADEWTAELHRIAAESKAFRITYEHIVATDSAVIALARPTGSVNRIRRMIGERLSLPSEIRNEANLVHTTLFRFSGSLSDPEQFLAMVENESANATSEVDELVVSKELVYPSLQTEVLERLPLASRWSSLQRDWTPGQAISRQLSAVSFLVLAEG